MRPPFINGPSFARRERERDQDPGWALTLADMMTLLLCFFVLLFTIAQVDQQKYEAMSSVLAEAMGGKEAPSKQAESTPASVVAPVDQVKKNLFELQIELADLVGPDSEGVDFKMRPDPYSVAISLGDTILFDSGRADLKPGAEALLARLAGPLTGTNYTLIIEGHTDDRPIQSMQFPSNWELSSARAAAVARFFIDRGFPKDRVQVLGLADTRPVAPNTSAANRGKNRRVVILVKPN